MYKNKLRSVWIESRQYFISRICLVFLIFITAILFINLVVNAIFYFLLSIVFAPIVLLLGLMISKYFFLKLPKKNNLIYISIFLSIAAIFIAPNILFEEVQHILNYANFYPMRDAYLKRIEMLDRTNEPLLITFEWKNASAKQLLIYDESNELDDRKRNMSKSWWKRAKEKDADFASCLWWQYKLAKSFFIVTFYCQAPYSGGAISSP